MKAVLDALGVSYVVEQGSDGSGNWYRRFSNGWVEQGGYVEYEKSNAIKNVVFPIEFNSTDYSVSIGTESIPTLFALASLAVFENKKQSNMDVQVGSASVGCFWEAKGYSA